jgi:hypothetical protein
MNKFELSLANDKIWNITELVKFLADNAKQDIYLIVNPEAHDLQACGLYNLLDCFEFNSVTIETSNCLEAHEKYKINKRSLDVFLDKNYWSDYDLSSSGIWNQNKLFGVFYGRPTANRIGIASYLFSNYFDQSQIVFSFDFQSVDERKLFEVEKLFQYRPCSVIDFANIINQQYNLNLDYTGFGHKYNKKNPMHDLYKNILIDIISEPNIAGETFYPTEKFSRCVLMKKPFIAMTSKNYLDYLHQMGFYTFNEFWNEDYDGYESADRYLKILDLLDTLASKTMDQLQALYNNMQFQLEHNYKLLTTQTYNKKITRII